jgi:hypothetical protein
MPSLDTIEKYGWTIFAFLVHRPQKFHKLRSGKRDRYMDPLPFAVANFFILWTVVFAAIRLLSPVLDRENGLGGNGRLPAGLSLPETLAVSGATQLFSLSVSVGIIKVAARMIGRRVLIRNSVIAFCYSSATNWFLIVYIGLALYLILTLGVSGGNATGLAGAFFLFSFPLSMIFHPYYISSTASISNISFRRLLLGYFIALLVLFYSLIILIAVVYSIYSFCKKV